MTKEYFNSGYKEGEHEEVAYTGCQRKINTNGSVRAGWLITSALLEDTCELWYIDRAPKEGRKKKRCTCLHCASKGCEPCHDQYWESSIVFFLLKIYDFFFPQYYDRLSAEVQNL